MPRHFSRRDREIASRIYLLKVLNKLLGLLNHWKSHRDREEGGAYSNQCSDLGEPYSCLQQHPSREIPDSGSVHLHSQGWPCLAREFSQQFCLIWVPSQQAELAAEPFLSPHLKKETIPAQLLSIAFSPSWPENLGSCRAQPIVQPCSGR